MARSSARTLRLAATLESRARDLHRTRGAPRLIDVTPTPAGTQTVCVLGEACLAIEPNGAVTVLHPSYEDLTLSGHPAYSPLVTAAERYVRELLREADTCLEAENASYAPTTPMRQRLHVRLAGKLKRTLWGLRVPGGALKALYATLWPRLDRDAARLAFRLDGGRHASLVLYEAARQHRDVLLQLERETPQFLPLVAVYAAPLQRSPHPDADLPLDRAIVGRIKARLRAEGLSGAGWRVLTRLGPGAMFTWRSLNVHRVAFTNLLGAGGPLPVPTTLWRWYRGSRLGYRLGAWPATSGVDADRDDPPREDPFPGPAGTADPGAVATAGSVAGLEPAELVRVFQLVLREAVRAKARHHLERFIDEDLRPLEDALLGTDTPLVLPRQLGWAWLQRFQQAWHEEQAARLATEQAGQTWDSKVPAYATAQYSVVPLVSASELLAEGRALRHCVASYAVDALQGRSRLFSIRVPGARRPVATLELRAGRGRPGTAWRVAQVRGFANGPVEPAVRRLGTAICQRYNQAEAAEARAGDAPDDGLAA